jgi:hypothetical protein
MRPFRVLSLDGGGMRGIYTAQYLRVLTEGHAKRHGRQPLDIGKAFDLIVGTSTGAIVACALASGVSLDKVVDLYKVHGSKIFPLPLKSDVRNLVKDVAMRKAALRRGTLALQNALTDTFGAETIGEVYERRGISIAVTAVNLADHRSWVFKSPHRVGKTNHRDDGYTLADVCLASSAAPIYRSVAALEVPGSIDEYNTFIDGGLWANNPILVAMIDALEVAKAEQPIELYSLGTCPKPGGTIVKRNQLHRGLFDWKFGAEAASISIDAQAYAFDQMARLLSGHLKKECRVIRFPREAVPAAMLSFLELDDTRPEAARALMEQARKDANHTNSFVGAPNDVDGQCLDSLLNSMPEFAQAER